MEPAFPAAQSTGQGWEECLNQVMRADELHALMLVQRAIENVGQIATLEERQRLTHELSDALTQTLFSANLIAEVLPAIWERDPQEGRIRLAELRRLTQGALALARLSATAQSNSVKHLEEEER